MKKNNLFAWSVVLTAGIIALGGCGGKTGMKLVPTPVAAAPVVTATPEETSQAQRYDVVKGDSLWVIAGRKNIYGNPFEWPLIFKANRDQIQDPDIIEIGQDLAISRDFSKREVARAIRAAKKTPRYVPHKKPRKHLPVEY